MKWHQLAVCAGPEGQTIDWVPTSDRTAGGQGSAELANLKAARAVCATCPVRGRCLDEAVRDNLEGIWAGTNMQQRRQLRRRILQSPQARDADLLARLEKEAGGHGSSHGRRGRMTR